MMNPVPERLRRQKRGIDDMRLVEKRASILISKDGIDVQPAPIYPVNGEVLGRRHRGPVQYHPICSPRNLPDPGTEPAIETLDTQEGAVRIRLGHAVYVYGVRYYVSHAGNDVPGRGRRNKISLRRNRHAIESYGCWHTLSLLIRKLIFPSQSPVASMCP